MEINQMQEKKSDIVKKVLKSLADHLGVKGIKGLAEYLGEDQNRLYAWIRNGNIVDTGIILTKCPNISREWLKTGDGDMITSVTSQEAIQNKIIVEKLKLYFCVISDHQLEIALGVDNGTLDRWRSGESIDKEWIKLKHPNIKPACLVAYNEHIVAEPPESFTATRYHIDIRQYPAAKQLLIEATINDMTEEEAFDLATDWKIKRRAQGGQGSS